MQTQDDFNFGVTLDNGNYQTGSDSGRQLGKPQPKANKKVDQNINNKPESKNQQNFTTNADNYALSRANNPGVCLATILFKGAAFFTYFFLGYLMSNVLTFIFTVILSSLDFWVVKNISGRILVGLRWWTDYDEKDNQIWKYQSHKEGFLVNTVDSSFFWTSQIVGTVVWGLFLLINVLQLDVFWALLMGINFTFCATNLYGYYMCRGQHKKKLGKLKQQIGKAGLMQLASRFA